jgi:hypothetical protein
MASPCCENSDQSHGLWRLHLPLNWNHWEPAACGDHGVNILFFAVVGSCFPHLA